MSERWHWWEAMEWTGLRTGENLPLWIELLSADPPGPAFVPSTDFIGAHPASTRPNAETQPMLITLSAEDAPFAFRKVKRAEVSGDTASSQGFKHHQTLRNDLINHILTYSGNPHVWELKGGFWTSEVHVYSCHVRCPSAPHSVVCTVYRVSCARHAVCRK